MAERFLNPETQFLDSSGKPRIDGKLAFHENGTLVDKDTFKDVNLTPALINTNPLLLTADARLPNCFYSGTARVIGTDDSGQFMDKENVGISGTGAAFDDFNSVTEYEKGALVIASDEKIYRSLQNNNQGNDPTSSPTFWEQVQFVGTFNVNITYADDDLVQASDGQLYRSIQAANLNNEPSASPTFWRNATADQDLNTTDDVTFNDVLINGAQAFGITELTIATGSITATSSLHSVDTESDAGTDNLDTIVVSGVPDNSLLYLKAENAARGVTVRDGVGNIQLNANNNLTLDVNEPLVLLRASATWFEVSRPGDKLPITGTWTPILTGTGTPGTYESVVDTGTFTQFGDLMMASCRYVLAGSITAGGTGSAQITGLPATKAGDGLDYGTIVFLRTVDYSATATQIMVAFDSTGATATVIFPEMNANAAEGAVAIGDFAASDQIQFTIIYKV